MKHNGDSREEEEKVVVLMVEEVHTQVSLFLPSRLQYDLVGTGPQAWAREARNEARSTSLVTNHQIERDV